MCKINPIQTIQKPSSIRKIKAQCPETESGFCFTFKLLQPWEEKMGLLMLLLVVMAASSHLISCGSPDCSRLYWMTAILHKVFKLGLKSKIYRSEWSMRLNSSPIPCSGQGLVPPKRMIRSPTIQQHWRLRGHGPFPLGSTFFHVKFSGLNFQRSLKCRSIWELYPPNMYSSPL